jgi:hypothetical protein
MVGKVQQEVTDQKEIVLFTIVYIFCTFLRIVDM